MFYVQNPKMPSWEVLITTVTTFQLISEKNIQCQVWSGRGQKWNALLSRLSISRFHYTLRLQLVFFLLCAEYPDLCSMSDQCRLQYCLQLFYSVHFKFWYLWSMIVLKFSLPLFTMCIWSLTLYIIAHYSIFVMAGSGSSRNEADTEVV